MSESVSPEFLALQAAVAGKYSLVRELGRGGMGVVFLAREVALDRLVAIKLLPPALSGDPALRERFLREARMAAQLAHPHITAIHAVESTGDCVYFAMEYVAGGTLGDRLRREGALPQGDALRIVQETAWALAHAHARGVIHRDVKPDNILLEEGTGRVLVTDFGIARAGEATDPAAGAGTLHYMSPEQVDGSADVRADVYALGVTAWHALAGRRPFEGQGGAALLASQARQDPPAIRTVVPTLPPPIAAAVDRAVQRDPEARWPAMEEFARALGAARALQPQLPLPLRRYAREAVEHSDRFGMALGVSAGAFLGAALVDLLFSTFLGIESAIFLLIGLVSSGMALALLGAHVVALRELAGRGYSREQALRAIAELEAEEPPVARPARLPFWNAPLGVGVGAAIAVVSGMALMVEGDPVVALPGLMLAILAPAVAIRRIAALRGSGGKWWTRFLRGRLGARAWRLFTAGVSAAPAAEVGGEPTALALGDGLRRLWAALPAAERQQLQDVPATVARLEALAMDRAHAHRTEAVMALESLRLDLLRLRAGEAARDGITTELGRLREVGWYVDAREEVGEQ